MPQILNSHRFVPEVTFNFVRNILSWFSTLHSERTSTAFKSCVTETSYQNKTSLSYLSPKLENIFFDKLSNYFGYHYLIWSLNSVFVEYLSKNGDMISTFSRRGCVL